MKGLYFLGLGLQLWVPVMGHAQKQVVHTRQIWFNYFNQTRFTERWGMWADASVRTREDWISDLSQVIGRVGLTYYLGNQTKLTAGYAYVHRQPPGCGHARTPALAAGAVAQ
jgi:hypothetical protein